MAERTSIFKPAGPHNPLLGPAVCLCVDCCRKVDALRCPVTDADGRRCGDYKHRTKEHSLLVLTVFQVVDARLHNDGPAK